MEGLGWEKKIVNGLGRNIYKLVIKGCPNKEVQGKPIFGNFIYNTFNHNNLDSHNNP